MPSISKHYILIIGGTSGIGYSTAKLALEAGANVAIASSNPVRVTEAVNKLKALFPDTHIEGYTCDLEHQHIESHLEHLCTTVTCDRRALLDHIISTAGRAPSAKPLAETSVQEILDKGKVGYLVPIVIAKLALRFLKPAYTSSLTFTGGHVSESPAPNYSLYSAFAAGLMDLTRNLALDMAPMRVNLVSPGSILTEMWGSSREQIGEVMGKKALLGKVGQLKRLLSRISI